MRTKGKIASWDDDKRFGFIAPNGGGKQIFVHIKAFSSRGKRPEINQIVTYTVSADKQGRPCADNVTRVGEKLPKGRKTENKSKSSKCTLCAKAIKRRNISIFQVCLTRLPII